MRTAVLVLPLFALAAPASARGQDDALVSRMSLEDLRRLALRLDKGATDASADRNDSLYKIRVQDEDGFITVEGKARETLRIYSRLDGNFALRSLNEWNRDKLYGRVYMDKDDSTVFESIILLKGGVSSRNIRAWVDMHFEQLKQFRTFIRNQ
jgi:hypothetical protein